MHILIGLLTAIGGVIWALYRLQNAGVDLNSFNPFYWLRRRKWQKQLGTKPIHRLDRPLDAAALLVVAIAKSEGEISREQKSQIIDIFVGEFKLPQSKAAELFSASAFMLRDVMNIAGEVRHILMPCQNAFTREQSDSLLQMMNRVAALEGDISDEQHRIISAVAQELAPPPEAQAGW